MVYIALISAAIGIAAGQLFFSSEAHGFLSTAADYTLYLLMFSVGVSVGMNESVLEKLKNYSFSILLIPIGTAIASVLGGFICGLIFDMRLADSLSVGAAMGWYSLSGVMLEALSGAEVGTISFMSSLMREFLAFMLIPVLVKYLNPYCAIAAAGATSEDTTLPMLIRYTSEEFIVISVINGMLCSIAVPVLINFFFSLFG